MSARKGFYHTVRELQGQVADMYSLRGLAGKGCWFVSTYNGSDTLNDGTSWNSPFKTMAKAIAVAATGETIYFVGKIAEEIVGSNLKFDIRIIGCGSLHHADQPGSGATAVDYGASVWQSPASPTKSLLTLRGRGWQLYNILFDLPTAYAGVRLERNSSSGLDEYDAGHASIIGCDFRNGLYGIQDYDGIFNATVDGCTFETVDATASAAAIITTANTGVAASRRWRITNNFFQGKSSTEGNERHIVMALNGSLIKGNTFGTVKGTGKYVDLTGGLGNVVTDNVFGGVYDTGDYVAGTNDLWYGNRVAVVAVTAPDGVTLAAPAAP